MLLIDNSAIAILPTILANQFSFSLIFNLKGGTPATQMRGGGGQNSVDFHSSFNSTPTKRQKSRFASPE